MCILRLQAFYPKMILLPLLPLIKIIKIKYNKFKLFSNSKFTFYFIIFSIITIIPIINTAISQFHSYKVFISINYLSLFYALIFLFFFNSFVDYSQIIAIITNLKGNYKFNAQLKLRNKYLNFNILIINIVVAINIKLLNSLFTFYYHFSKYNHQFSCYT